MSGEPLFIGSPRPRKAERMTSSSSYADCLYILVCKSHCAKHDKHGRFQMILMSVHDPENDICGEY